MELFGLYSTSSIIKSNKQLEDRFLNLLLLEVEVIQTNDDVSLTTRSNTSSELDV